MKLRGYLTVGSVGLCLLLGDLVQRTVVAFSVWVLPAKRDRILGRWQRFIAWLVLTLVRRVGGASISELPRLPAGPGVLVLMNHQSLLDIPLVVASHEDLYPRIVTRARYARGKPLISHMIRLYQYPLVDPRATVRGHLRGLKEAAAEGSTPVMIYPEGTRTRDGGIGPWKRRGLRLLLEARRWTVYMLVADGFWQAARLADFVASVSTIDGRVVMLGPFESPSPGEPVDPFIDEMRTRMTEALASLRTSPST